MAEYLDNKGEMIDYIVKTMGEELNLANTPKLDTINTKLQGLRSEDVTRLVNRIDLVGPLAVAEFLNI